jgi:prolyl-tRNA editing enzyme YbaK/EbsC (Cys-tRNA(Pro) deacylase)
MSGAVDRGAGGGTAHLQGSSCVVLRPSAVHPRYGDPLTRERDPADWQLMAGVGTLEWEPFRATLVAAPVADALADWPLGREVRAAEIDPALADTAAFCKRYRVRMEDSANCVVIAGRRGAETRYAACVILATTRVDVNGVVRRRLDARKASFAPVEDAVARTGMDFGGITPIGLPAGWPLFVDEGVLGREIVVIGSGLRRSKLCLPARHLSSLPGAEVVANLAN